MQLIHPRRWGRYWVNLHKIGHDGIRDDQHQGNQNGQEGNQ